MSSDEHEHSILTSRRKMLAASGSATMLAIAGCSGATDDADDGDDTDDQGDDHDDSADDGTGEGTDDPESQEAILLIENVTQEGEVEFNLLDRNDDEAVIADVHGDHWHGEPLEVPDDPEENLSLGAEIIDEAGDEVELDGSHHGLEVAFADGASEDYVSLDEHGDHVHVIGEEEGETELVFRWIHDDHTEYQTPPLAVDVDHDHAHDNGHDNGHGDDEVETFEVLDRNDDEEVAAYVDGDHWHGDLPEVEEGDNLSLGAFIEDEDGEEVELDGDHYELRVDHGDHAHEDVVSFDYHGDHVHIIGEEEGHTDVVFQLYHDDHVEYETPSIEVDVGHGHDDDNGDVETFEVLDRNDDEEVAAYVDGDHWHGDLPEVDEGDNLSLGAFIEDEDGDEVELDGDHYELRVDYGDHAHEDVVSFDYHGDHVHIIGEEEGHTDVVFQLYHDDHVEYETPSIEVDVGHGHNDDNDNAESYELSEFEILDRDDDEEVTAYWHGDHWHGGLPSVEEGDNLSLGAYVEDADGEEIELDGDHYELSVRLADDEPEDVVEFDYHGDHVHIIGDHEGTAEVVFELVHEGDVVFDTSHDGAAVEVEHGHDDEEHGYEDDVEHACMHFDDHHTGIDEAEALDGGESDDDPAVVAETHRTYNVSFEGDSTYVMFDVAEYGGGEEFMFLTEEGQVEAIVGEKVEEAHDIDEGMCEYVDMWAVIEPEDDEIVVRLSPEN